MVNRIFNLYDDLEKDRTLLLFKGVVTTPLIAAIMNLLERMMQHCEHTPIMRKRVFNVVLECLHNLFHHHSHPAMVDNAPGRCACSQSVVMIAHGRCGYSVLTGNAMAQPEVGALKQRLDLVNACGPGELRNLYKNTLNNGTFTPSGGGGLGLIDMARRSGHKLAYGFVPMDNDNAFFSLRIHVGPKHHR